MNSKKRSRYQVYVKLSIYLVLLILILIWIAGAKDRIIPYPLLILSVLVSFVIGSLLGREKLSNNWLEKIDLDHDHSIYETFKGVLRRNFSELILIFMIGIVGIVITTYWLEWKFKEDIPTTIGLFLSYISVLVTVIGMFYAFLAEKQAHEAVTVSRALLEDKGEFLEHFAGFINRINRKLDDPERGIFSDISLDQKNETYFYYIKCMFLTPFLAHAGIKANNKAMFKSFHRFQANITKLIESHFCDVKILTLNPKQLVDWYAQIQWIEEVENKDKEKNVSFLDFTENDKHEIIEKIKKTLIHKKGLGALLMDDDVGEVPSYSSLVNDYNTRFSGNKGNGSKKLQICQTEYIPFQFFLVMKQKHSDSEGIRHNSTDSNEVGKFVILTYVGDKTYYEMIKDIAKGIHPRNGGIDDVLKNLHSAFYSEDPRMCEILNNHFNNYWDFAEQNQHCPSVADDEWEKWDGTSLPDKCKPKSIRIPTSS